MLCQPLKMSDAPPQHASSFMLLLNGLCSCRNRMGNTASRMVGATTADSPQTTIVSFSSLLGAHCTRLQLEVSLARKRTSAVVAVWLTASALALLSCCRLQQMGSTT